MSTHGRSGLRRALSGSVADAVVSRAFRILIASDGSPAARAAVATALAFPWSARTQASAVIARRGWPTADLEHVLEQVSADLSRTLRQRWPQVRVAIVDQPPVDAIVAEAIRLRAGAIVLGWRGFGTFRRLLLGSVSRSVARRAHCAVLVSRRRLRRVHSLIVGLDGSTNAGRAAAFVGSLPAPRGARVTLVRVVNPPMQVSPAFTRPRTRVRLSRELAAVHEEDVARAKQYLDSVAPGLAPAGWDVRTTVRSGEPLHEILALVEQTRADLLVVGAQGATGLKRILLGSVAEGALNRARVPVLVVR